MPNTSNISPRPGPKYPRPEYHPLCFCAQGFCRGEMSLHQLSRYIAGKGVLPAKYATLEKAVGFEMLFMCVTPGKKTKSIYEMMPGDIPGEALDEFKRLQGSYESPHHSYMMSKDGVRELFYTQLRTGILDISRHVAPSQGSTKRPFPFPDHPAYEPHRKALAEAETWYFARLIAMDSSEDEGFEDAEEAAAEEAAAKEAESDGSEVVIIKVKRGPRIGLCDFPGCEFDDVEKRDCVVCGADGMHHHMCAINNGQEDISTMCMRCTNADFGLRASPVFIADESSAVTGTHTAHVPD